MVVDHTSYAVSELKGDHTLLASDVLIESEVIFGKNKIEVCFLITSENMCWFTLEACKL